MITILNNTTNLFNTDTEAIVNTVNCVGVMGAGIALQFKNKYMDNFIAYKNACDKHLVVPGKMFIYETNYITNPKYIINFPTKRHWQCDSQIDDIEEGLYSLIKDIKHLDIKSITIPPLGCGLGGLNWDIVKPLIISILNPISNNVNVLIIDK